MDTFKEIKVYIALSDQNETKEFIEKINKFGNTKVIASSSNGSKACSDILKIKPDIILLDILLEEIDGMGVLERLYCLRPNYHPNILVLSNTGNDNVTSRIFRLGATYMMLRPINAAIVAERIKQFCMPYDNGGTVNDFIMEGVSGMCKYTVSTGKEVDYGYSTCLDTASWILKSINIPMHLSGYAYILESLKIYLEFGSNLPCITKDVYPRISKMFNVEASRVERCIRSIIDYIWLNGDIKNIECFFGNYIDYRMSGKPGNAQFMAMLCDMVKTLCKGRIA